jgi:N4-gp56 family major capsid protein
MEDEVGIIGELRVVENANAPLTATGTPGVYTCECIVVGKDHTSHIPVRGKGSTEFILQPLGSGGTSDPLKRVGTAGWQAWLGAKVLYPERLAIIKANVNY